MKKTQTKETGYTTLERTGDIEIDQALAYIEDGISFLYYAVKDNGYAGHQNTKEAIKDTIGFLQVGLDIIKERK